ncbi:MAG: hypothetical protein ABR527_08890 [Gemmatimonadota bacterium]
MCPPTEAPKKPSRRRNEQLGVRITPVERELINAAASRLGLSSSGLCRVATLHLAHSVLFPSKPGQR